MIYLCEAVNEYFRDRVTPDELVWSFAGVRSLYDDGADKPEDVTRDYVLDARRARPRGAAADGLWRQDHHLPPACRSGAGAAFRISRRARRGPRNRACRAAISRSMVSTTRWRRRSAAGRSSPSRTPGAWCVPMARASNAFSAMRRACTTCGRSSAGDLTGAEVHLSGRERMGAQRRRRAVAAQQARPHRDAEERAALGAFIADLLGEPPR